MGGHTLGRRNAAPVQSTKLDLSSNCISSQQRDPPRGICVTLLINAAADGKARKA